MRPAKIVAIIIGALLIIIGLGLLVPGSILLWLHGTADSEGYLNTSERRLQSEGHALVTPDVRLHLGAGDWMPGDWAVQLRATSTGDGPVFLGIGPTDEVQEYLGGVGYDEVTNIGWFSSGDIEYSNRPGTGTPPTPPAQQTFWTAQREGTGTQTLQWRISSGNWTAVLMNADGGAPVTADVTLGARLGFLLPLGIGLLVGGLVLLAVGILLVILGARRPREPLPSAGYPTGPPYGQPPYGQPPYGQQPHGQPPYEPPPYAPYAPPPYQQPAVPAHEPPPSPPPPEAPVDEPEPRP